MISTIFVGTAAPTRTKFLRWHVLEIAMLMCRYIVATMS